MAKSKINISEFMATPITDVATLEKNSNDMKAKMELMIMKIQVVLIFSLLSKMISYKVETFFMFSGPYTLLIFNLPFDVI